MKKLDFTGKVLLFVASALVIAVASFFTQSPSHWGKSADEIAFQILQEPNGDAAMAKRKAEFEKLMKDRGPGPSQALRDFNIASDRKAPKKKTEQ